MIKISKKGKFCAVCGTSTGPFRENLCENCFKKEYPLDIDIINSIEVEICTSCETLYIAGSRIETWKREENLEELIREVTRARILEKIYTDVSFEYEFLDNIEDSKVMNRGVKEFEVKTTIRAQPYKEFDEFQKEQITKLKLIRTNCDECTKYKSGYFEAILQVRGDNRKLTEKEVVDIEELIEKIMNQYEDAKMSYIMDFTADQNGITAQISTKYLAESIAKEIKAQTAGKMSAAYEHKTTSKDGSEVYTNTYLVRLPEYTEGDIIEYEKILWVVKGVTDQQIKVESLETHEIKRFERKRVEDKGRKKSEEAVEREYILVSIEKNNVVMMALDNYENYEDNLERLPRNKEAGENIRGFIIEDRNYYVE